MNWKNLVLPTIVLSLLISCAAEPQPINYGSDACTFCEMTIVDQQHASELVTKKGKVYKYDSIECLLHDFSKKKPADIALFLVTDYAHPGVFTNALKATYLISEKISSPMGANLSGFRKKADAIKTQEEKGGHIYDWLQVKEKF